MNRLHRFDILVAWYEEYLALQNRRPRTISSYSYHLSLFRRWLESNTDTQDIEEITRESVNGFAGALYDRGMSSRTIHSRLESVKLFFGVLYRNNKLYTNPAAKITLPRESKPLPQGILSEQDIGRVYAYFESAAESLDMGNILHAKLMRDQAIFDVLYSTGMRLAEICHLNLEDVQYTEGLISIREGKGGKDRIVPIGKKTCEVLYTYITRARPVLNTRGIEALFISCNGNNRIGKESLRQAVQLSAKRAGIEKRVRVHGLRHSCATHMLDHGADIRYVQELLGHASLSSTQVYTHVSINRLKETHSRFHPREQEDFAEETAPEETHEA
jgi:integrase/recombinase XerD